LHRGCRLDFDGLKTRRWGEISSVATFWGPIIVRLPFSIRKADSRQMKLFFATGYRPRDKRPLLRPLERLTEVLSHKNGEAYLHQKYQSSCWNRREKIGWRLQSCFQTQRNH